MTDMCRDYQKSKVYTWENTLPHKVRYFPIEEIQGYTTRVWHENKLQWPPLVMQLAPQDKNAGKGSRGCIYFPSYGARELVILHELAHAMTSTYDGYGDAHGPKFLGVYMRLLCNHLDIPLPYLTFTATKAKLDYDITAQPWCGK